MSGTEYCTKYSAGDPQWYPARQSIRLDPKGKPLRDEEVLQLLPVGTTATLYFKDLGPQIGWTLVFLIEYTGPLFIYFVFYFRMPFIYGLDDRFPSSRHPVVNLACICHSFHYIKRLIETLFVHRFSHGTMPLRNIVKNCFYYWGFAAWLAYYINHPLYTPPSYGQKQINFALVMVLTCEAGNFSIHVALSNLRRDGFKTSKIPYPTKNPFTWLFYLVSCPNYTYETRSLQKPHCNQLLMVFLLLNTQQKSLCPVTSDTDYHRDGPLYRTTDPISPRQQYVVLVPGNNHAMKLTGAKPALSNTSSRDDGEGSKIKYKYLELKNNGRVHLAFEKFHTHAQAQADCSTKQVTEQEQNSSGLLFCARAPKSIFCLVYTILHVVSLSE
ncbi:hypothetical protein JRQ81_014649 [Phrynocephalus forsythii]|uniref:Steroid 5-alpha reductase C-terminal domain-containing protein n=1 Tax=Phrynocephalus forsythii TaxID=171643 RepID=A0A9Q0XX32_9SAUR|nr:hypothetical protein JRQ81_014649 [Phrynocephalus forsythii]